VLIRWLERNPGPHDLIALFLLVRALRACQPRIVHSHAAKAGTLGRLAALVAFPRSRRPVLIHTFHGHSLTGYFSSRRSATFLHIERFLARHTDCLIAVSAEVRDELAELGVAPPERVPMVYVVEPDLVTTASRLVVKGTQTSGEVEFFLAPTPDGLLVGVGSDHTDREQEAIDVATSKRLCPKVVSRSVWRYADVEDHWDQIEIRAWVTKDGERRLYQEGTLAAFMPVADLLAELERVGYPDLAGRLVFGGTLPALGGFVYGERFECELRDPLLDRRLACAYDVVVAQSGV
jgi:hypothetical protein